MRTPVKCNNCGINWIRIVAIYDIELNIDLMPNCPNCGSNDYTIREKEETEIVKE